MKMTFEPACVWAQPSGTVREKPPAGTLDRTNWVLSGMSPGGAFSFAFGLAALDGVVEPLLFVLAVELVLELEPQPATTNAATAKRAINGRVRCMPATVRPASPREVRPRST